MSDSQLVCLIHPHSLFCYIAARARLRAPRIAFGDRRRCSGYRGHSFRKEHACDTPVKDAFFVALGPCPRRDGVLARVQFGIEGALFQVPNPEEGSDRSRRREASIPALVDLRGPVTEQRLAGDEMAARRSAVLEAQHVDVLAVDAIVLSQARKVGILLGLRKAYELTRSSAGFSVQFAHLWDSAGARPSAGPCLRRR